ncbi:hypothetical protein QFC19_008872 [Naganishia cerealis]|uniref:Uncharacterized protein n=1 Tax=Naganishia cerealis TaxID=610337 RepID=A0ACC2UY62_9TREE|nr:hypothetical protein QFC19_008872 [Naganishia cerealis]
MAAITGYPPNTAIELQDMDSQPRLRQNANKSTVEPPVGSTSTPLESDDIHAKLPHVSDEDVDTEADDGFDVISYWAIGASIWFAILALPLLLFPRLLLFLSQTRPEGTSFLAKAAQSHGQHYDDLSPLEKFLCTQLGLGIVVVMGNGSMGVWGWWVGAFGVSAGLRSKKTVRGELD